MSKINFQDDSDMFGRLFVFTGDPIFHQLKNVASLKEIDLNDAFSWGQLKSKRWLVNELEKINPELGTVFLCAGWYATLASMLFKSSCKLNKIRSFDLDDSCAAIADTINRPFVLDNWKFKASTLNIQDITYPLTYSTLKSDGSRVELTDEADTIINTSCEHIENFKDWYDSIPTGKLVILQTNNYFEIKDHINCSKSLDDFAEKTNMSTVLFQGELELPKYKRFMRIGIK